MKLFSVVGGTLQALQPLGDSTWREGATHDLSTPTLILKDPGRLGGHTEAGEDRSIGVENVRERQAVTLHELINLRLIPLPGNADHGDFAGPLGCDLLDRGGFEVAGASIRGPEPEGHGLAEVGRAEVGGDSRPDRRSDRRSGERCRHRGCIRTTTSKHADSDHGNDALCQDATALHRDHRTSDGKSQPRRAWRIAVTTLPSALPLLDFMMAPTSAPMALSSPAQYLAHASGWEAMASST